MHFRPHIAPKDLGQLAFCAAMAAVAAHALSGPFFDIGLCLFFPYAFVRAEKRWIAALTALTYHLVGARGLVSGATHYFGFFSAGLTIWLAAGVIQAAVWTLCWSPDRFRRQIGSLVAILILAVPPIGIVGWNSPLIVAGLLFPHFGWYGLALIAAIIFLLPILDLPRVIVFLFVMSLYGVVVQHSPMRPPGWAPANTQFGGAATRSLIADYHNAVAMRDAAEASPDNVIAFPESVGGLWTPTTQGFWSRRSTATDILVGAEIPLPGGAYDNAIVSSSRRGGLRVIYRQRMPVPISMWKPFSSTGARAHWFANPIVRYDGYRVAPLICYEEFLVWPVLQSMLHKPDVVVAVANDWWAADTSIPRTQRNAVGAWALLFGLRLVSATNL